jgi:large conductance mechanosensitive channel
MLKEFKAFITRGNVVDFAVGVIVGAAFGRIITSLVNDIVMPPIGLLLGGVSFNSLFIALNGQHYNSLGDAQAAGAPTINYGTFINTIIDFLIVAMAVFILVRIVQRLLPPPHSREMRDCPRCLSNIPKGATRCPHCTSKLDAEVDVEAEEE